MVYKEALVKEDSINTGSTRWIIYIYRKFSIKTFNLTLRNYDEQTHFIGQTKSLTTASKES